MNNKTSPDHEKFLNKVKNKKKIIFISQIFIFVAFFAIWEICANQKIIDPFLFSKPSTILESLVKMTKDGSIFVHTGITIWETFLGFILSTILGTAFAVLLWWNDFIRKVLNPYLVILNSIPKTALAPIIIVWVGNNVKSVIVTAVMTSIVVTIINVLTGFLDADKEKIKLIQTFGGTKTQILLKVVFPSSISTIISTIKINIGLSLVGVIVGEFLVAKSGLGYLIVYGSQIFKMDFVMLSVLMLGLLAALLYQIIVVLEKRIIKYF